MVELPSVYPDPPAHAHLIKIEVKLIWQTMQTLECPVFGHYAQKTKEVKEA